MRSYKKIYACVCVSATILESAEKNLIEPHPLQGAWLFLTISLFRYYGPLGLVFSIYDSTEVAIEKMISFLCVKATTGNAKLGDVKME